MDAPGEGLGTAITENNKALVKTRGGCNFPVPACFVSHVLRLAIFLGYIIVCFGLIGAILAPVRDLGQSMGTLFPWRPSIPPVNGPFRLIRTLCIALGLGQVLGNPSLGWVGVVCVVECALRTWWHGVGLCPPDPLQRQRTCFSAVTGHRCHFLEVFSPSMDQGGRGSPGMTSQAGASLLSGMHSCVASVCVRSVALFCQGALCGLGLWGAVFPLALLSNA